MTLNENLNSAADEQNAKLQDCKVEAELADGVAGEDAALSDDELEQVSGGTSEYFKPAVKRFKRKKATVSGSALGAL